MVEEQLTPEQKVFVAEARRIDYTLAKHLLARRGVARFSEIPPADRLSFMCGMRLMPGRARG
jgi:hypothetical protein